MLVGFYFWKVPFDMQQSNGVLENALDGFVQLGNNPVLLIAFISKWIRKMLLRPSMIMYVKCPPNLYEMCIVYTELLPEKSFI